MKIRVVTTLREFDGLAPAWQSIVREGGQTSPFLSHDWFACCWRSAGPERRREAWVFEDGGSPLAIVPLLRWRARIHRLPVRMLGLMTAVDTPFVDVVAARAAEDVVTALFSELRRRRDWDVLSVVKMPPDAVVAKAVERALPPDFRCRVAGVVESPYLHVTGDWDAFLKERSQRFRKTLRNVENRVHRAGAVAVEEHRAVTPESTLFAEIMDVASQSWKGPRALAMSTMPGMPRFFGELTRRASANGWLRLWVLRLDGQAVATEYQIVDGDVVHALRADFDASKADLSPGAYLNGQIVRTLFERGEARSYEMGPGANDYKLRWASGVHAYRSLRLYAPTTYGRMLYGLETRLAPLVRQWRNGSQGAQVRSVARPNLPA
ncbi:MAG TPA: GNAT family N-acetyltransferase, partial [Candidatus Tectomicrobia bacterium]|nr:GNAT family N-acetyltransferase [Candidatus Tectomicrobia bacterium]